MNTVQNENLQGDQLNIDFPSNCIPYVINCLYNEKISSSIQFEEIRDAFRLKQIQSKSWLLSYIKKFTIDQDIDISHKKILVIGSWIGFTSFCLSKLGFKNIHEVDPDPRLEKFSQFLNRHNKNFVHFTTDVNDIDISNYDYIVNTSCEHIENNTWFTRISNKSIMFLHSNNLIGYDHTNTCSDLLEMELKYPMKLFYKGQLNLGSYSRFMLIGTKHESNVFN